MAEAQRHDMLIRDWRRHHGLSMAAAARVLGFTQASAIHYLERGMHAPEPENAERIYQVTKALGPEPVGEADHIATWRKGNPQAVHRAKAWVSTARQRYKAEKRGKDGEQAGRTEKQRRRA